MVMVYAKWDNEFGDVGQSAQDPDFLHPQPSPFYVIIALKFTATNSLMVNGFGNIDQSTQNPDFPLPK